LSEAAALDPAVGLLEYTSIAAGIVAGDAMVKASPVGSIYAGTVHPGKYLVLVSGDTASVETALDAGRDAAGEPPLDQTFLPDIHPAVTDAITKRRPKARLVPGGALGIVETETVGTILHAADAGVKAALVQIGGLRLADGLGGKSYLLFSGEVAEVEASVERAVFVIDPPSLLVRERIIPQLHEEMAANLASQLRFSRRVELRPRERGV
jgi:microcompartment protein CcmL/EutN